MKYLLNGTRFLKAVFTIKQLAKISTRKNYFLHVLNVEYFQDATGKISEGTKINIREVKIGEMVLENVEALVVDNVNAPLLLGQTVLERFGSIEIDNVNGEIIFK